MLFCRNNFNILFVWIFDVLLQNKFNILAELKNKYVLKKKVLQFHFCILLTIIEGYVKMSLFVSIIFKTFSWIFNMCFQKKIKVLSRI